MQCESAWLAPALAFVLALGCSDGSVGAEQANADLDPPGSAPGTGGTTTNGSDSSTASTGAMVGSTTGGADVPPLSPSAEEACPTQALPRTPLRRLTRFEYANTVRDLLGVDTSAVLSLPEDNATNGFDNNASVQVVSELHAEKYVLVSEQLAEAAVQDVAALTACDPIAVGEEACALQFARSFGRLAFRRSLSSADEQLLMTAFEAGRTGGSYTEGIEVMIRAALQSPHFLYRLETTTPADPTAALVPLNPFELATRLSYMIWGSAPDDALLAAAENGELSTKEQVASAAREMLSSPKARASLANFVNQWSGLSRLDITTKNTALFPTYSLEIRDAMARELAAFLDYVLDSGDASLRNLLTANAALVSGPLANVYGVATPAGSETAPQLVAPPEEQRRSGLLTLAGFLSVHAHPDQTSPVLRGKFVRANLLCDPPPPPPDDVDISVPEVTQGTTARDRAALHLSAGAGCNGCHTLLDPIGLAFENFDALGQYREAEAGQPIDASGEVLSVDDPNLQGAFVGVRGLAEKLVQSEVVHDCVASQWFRFASGRGEGAADSCSIATLQDAFSASEGDLIELVVATTQTDAFLFRSQVTE